MAISMRHTKMKAEEVALLAGEVTKPTWQSRNEGIHERVSFEDTIWGFDLAGGSYYRTPLRVTLVKPGSRAELANVKPGDLLLSINGKDTSTMTIQEAHDMIVESGINIKLHVTAPEDIQDSFYYYEDPPVDETPIDDLKIIEERLRRQREYNLRSAHHLKLHWPWVSKKFLIYRESNCFMVNSKYESARRDKYPERPSVRLQDVIVFDKFKDDKPEIKEKNETKKKAKKDEVKEDLVEDNNEEEDGDVLNTENEDDNQEELSSIDEPSAASVEEQELNQSKDLETTDINNNRLEEELTNDSETVDRIPEGEINGDITEENGEAEDSKNEEDKNEIVNNTEEDDIINEVLEGGDVTPKADEENILNGVLNDDEGNSRQSENER